jgi:hypothetical protein
MTKHNSTAYRFCKTREDFIEFEKGYFNEHWLRKQPMRVLMALKYRVIEMHEQRVEQDIVNNMVGVI